ncbi:Speract receptor [Orchesella cincta]|uniref:Speract receptor n=1 Tax=Orchesella cincta TaxID=48709 RepID=A0A1D2N5J5_ORCCI|nr:Speract receptor [Orchesella cincta]
MISLIEKKEYGDEWMSVYPSIHIVLGCTHAAKPASIRKIGLSLATFATFTQNLINIYTFVYLQYTIRAMNSQERNRSMYDPSSYDNDMYVQGLHMFCSDEATSDKQHFPTFSRSRPPDAAISRAVASLVLNYGWCDSLTVIYSDSTDDQRFKRVAKSLSLLFQERGVSTHPEISYRGPYHHGYVDNPFDTIVKQTKDTTRSK